MAGGEGFECPKVKRARQLTHSTASAVDHTRQNRFTLCFLGGGRGRRGCALGAALSSLLIKPTHRMARPRFRDIHRASDR